MPLHGPFTSLSRPHFLPKKLAYFSAAAFCIEVGLSFLFISGPVYIYQVSLDSLQLHNLPLLQHLTPVSAGLIGLALFYLVQRLGCLLFLPVVQRTIKTFGFTPSLIIGSLAYLLKYSLFLLFPMYPWMIFVTALLSGYGLLLYWISLVTLLSAEVSLPAVGKEVGSFEFVSRLGQIMAPLLGALLSVRFGFVATILVSGFFFITASTLFSYVPNIHTKAFWQPQKYLAWLRDKNTLLVNIAMGAFQWERFGTTIFWPVFLFLTFETQEAVGYILSAATFIALMFVYISGWMFDQSKYRRRLRMITGSLTGLLWIPRILLIQTPLVVVVNDAFDRVLKGMYSTIFFAMTIVRARNEKMYEFMVHREVTICLTLILLLSVFILLVAVGLPWELVFLTVAAASFVSLVFPSNNRKKSRSS